MPKILFILHLPPPVHGPSMVGQIIKDSELINSVFTCRYINLSTSHTVDEIGKNPLGKVGRYLSMLSQIFWQLLVFRPNLCYITLSSTTPGFYKDFPVTLLVRLFGVKIVYHLHNKGVSKLQHRKFEDKLFRCVF